MLELGWTFEAQAFEEQPLIWCQEYQAIMPADESLEGCNVAWTMAVCPWPPAEDPEQLLAVAERTQASALDREMDWRDRTGARSPA